MEMMIMVMVMILMLMMIVGHKPKNKDVLYINNENKISTRKFDIYDIFYSYLKKDISYEDIKGLRNNIGLPVKY